MDRGVQKTFNQKLQHSSGTIFGRINRKLVALLAVFGTYSACMNRPNDIVKIFNNQCKRNFGKSNSTKTNMSIGQSVAGKNVTERIVGTR